MLWDFAHSYRIIPIDGRPHVGSKLKLWQGDSRGQWEGNTLVVDTTNQHGKSLDMMGDFHGDGLHVVERFAVVDADTIHYEATLDDPDVYTQRWTMALTLRRDREVQDIWEMACHEGNRLEVPGMP